MIIILNQLNFKECGFENSENVSLKNFDTERVLRYGLPLLASGGDVSDFCRHLIFQEFDGNFSENLSIKERIAAQKKNLKKRLGLEYSGVGTEILEIFEIIQNN
jgi:hypothetical protein